MLLVNIVTGAKKCNFVPSLFVYNRKIAYLELQNFQKTRENTHFTRNLHFGCVSLSVILANLDFSFV